MAISAAVGALRTSSDDIGKVANDAWGGIKDVKPFAAKRKLTYTLLLDPKGAVKRKYGVRLIPATFIIDRRGIVRSVHIGFVPGMEKTLEAEVKALRKEQVIVCR